MAIKDKILEVYQKLENQLSAKQDVLTSQQINNINSVANKANLTDLNYSIVTPEQTTSGTTVSVSVQDRSMNLVQLASTVTSVNITFPTKVNGKARDFFIRLVITGSTVPQISFVETTGLAPSFDVADDEWANIEQGVNILMFSETN